MNVNGEIKKTLGKFVEIEWRISDFLHIPKDLENHFCSPSFIFLERNWQLGIFYDEDGTASSAISVILMPDSKVNSLVQCSLSLKSAQGKKLYEVQFIENFGKREEGSRFFKKLLTEPELLDNSASLLPGGALTILCSLRHCDSCSVSRTDESVQNFQSLLTEGICSDLTIIVEEEEFKLHRYVLRFRTPFFLGKVMEDETSEGGTIGKVELTNCKKDVFRLFVQYAYTGRAELTDDTVWDLFDLAEACQVEELKDECSEYMHKNFQPFILHEVVHLVRKMQAKNKKDKHNEKEEDQDSDDSDLETTTEDSDDSGTSSSTTSSSTSSNTSSSSSSSTSSNTEGVAESSQGQAFPTDGNNANMTDSLEPEEFSLSKIFRYYFPFIFKN